MIENGQYLPRDAAYIVAANVNASVANMGGATRAPSMAKSAKSSHRTVSAAAKKLARAAYHKARAEAKKAITKAKNISTMTIDEQAAVIQTYKDGKTARGEVLRSETAMKRRQGGTVRCAIFDRNLRSRMPLVSHACSLEALVCV
jgi:hypothetical protein